MPTTIRTSGFVGQGGTGNGGGGGGGADPNFGDNGSDTLIWQETFESYADTAAMLVSGGGPWSRGADTNATLDTTGGVGASKGLKMVKSAGTAGPVLTRGIGGSPTHFFGQFSVKIETSGNPRMKFYIIHNSAEGQAGCLGKTTTRYQFPLSDDDAFLGNIPRPRLVLYASINSECNGPVSGIPDQGEPDNPQWFVWGADPDEPPPVLSTDSDIGSVGWNPIDDGNFHRITVEILTGNSGYRRFWYDGTLIWDESGTQMNFPGLPTQWKWELVSGTASDAFTMWIDNMTIWKRA